MKIKPKRKNPADNTGRNNNARKKEVAELKAKVQIWRSYCKLLGAYLAKVADRVTKLERKRKG